MTSHPTPSASASPAASFWLLVLAAASVLMVTMGVRMTLGLYVAPINQATGLGIAGISFALAVSQIMWGVSQPLFGAVADRYGPGGSLFAGAAMMAVATAMA